MPAHKPGHEDPTSPYIVTDVDVPVTPKFRWRILPCFFLACYGLPLMVGPLIWSATIVFLERTRGKEMRVFHRMEHWELAMVFACLAGVCLLSACRFVWRSSWTRGIAMVLAAAVFGGLFLMTSGGLRPAR